MYPCLRIRGAGLAVLLLLGLPALAEAQIYARPVYVPSPPPPVRVTYSSPTGQTITYSAQPLVVSPARYSFYETPSQIGQSYYYPPPAPGETVYLPPFAPPVRYYYEPGYYKGYYSPRFFRY
jgi:hypothetical protein